MKKTTFMPPLHRRPRRLRQNQALRNMVQECHLSTDHLILPVFVCDGIKKEERINSLPGVSRFSPDLLMKFIKEASNAGIKSIALFPKIDTKLKDTTGSHSLNPNNLNFTTIQAIKAEFPDINLIADVALDPYTTHGHDGLVQDETILNDETVEVLAEMSVQLASAGADIVAPSDMMDGRVHAIRKALDHHGHQQTLIMSYTAKYASAFYGPFREAVASQLSFGDKRTYQMDPANRREAILEAQLDTQEGADFLMVKPGLPYLDVIMALKSKFHIPVAAYNVSGEYAMIKAAAQNGWLDEKKAVMEVMTSFRRAGADAILTYHALDVARWINLP